MNRVMRPVLWLVIILALGIAVIYLDQTGRFSGLGTPSNSTNPTTPPNPDPFNQIK